MQFYPLLLCLNITSYMGVISVQIMFEAVGVDGVTRGIWIEWEEEEPASESWRTSFHPRSKWTRGCWERKLKISVRRGGCRTKGCPVSGGQGDPGLERWGV